MKPVPEWHVSANAVESQRVFGSAKRRRLNTKTSIHEEFCIVRHMEASFYTSANANHLGTVTLMNGVTIMVIVPSSYRPYLRRHTIWHCEIQYLAPCGPSLIDHMSDHPTAVVVGLIRPMGHRAQWFHLLREANLAADEDYDVTDPLADDYDNESLESRDSEPYWPGPEYFAADDEETLVMPGDVLAITDNYFDEVESASNGCASTCPSTHDVLEEDVDMDDEYDPDFEEESSD